MESNIARLDPAFDTLHLTTFELAELSLFRLIYPFNFLKQTFQKFMETHRSSFLHGYGYRRDYKGGVRCLKI